MYKIMKKLLLLSKQNPWKVTVQKLMILIKADIT